MTKKVSKKTSVDKEVSAPSNALLDRLTKLEMRQKILVDGLKWAGGEIKGMFGVSIIGSMLLEIAAKVEKAGE